MTKEKNSKRFNWVLIITILLLVMYVGFLVIFVSLGKETNFLELKDWFAFWGSSFTFFGTFLLAVITNIQNERLSKQNEQLIAENKKQFQITNQKNIPMLKISGKLISSTKINTSDVDLTQWRNTSSHGYEEIIDESGKQTRCKAISANISMVVAGMDGLFKDTVWLSLTNNSEAIINKIHFYEVSISNREIFETKMCGFDLIVKEYTLSESRILEPYETLLLKLNIYYNSIERFKQSPESSLSIIADIETITGYHIYQQSSFFINSSGTIDVINNKQSEDKLEIRDLSPRKHVYI